MFGIEWLSGNLFNLIEGVLSLIVFASLWRKYKREDISSIRQFSMYFLFFAGFQLIIGLQYFASGLSGAQVLGYMIFGMFLFYVSLSYLPRVMFSIYKPEWEMKAFTGMIGISALATGYHLLNWTMIGPMTPLMVWGSSVLLLAIPFAYLGWKQESQRWKMWLVAAGFTMKAAAGTLISLGGTEAAMGIAEFLTFSGLALIALGLFKGEELSK